MTPRESTDQTGVIGDWLLHTCVLPVSFLQPSWHGCPELISELSVLS